MSKRRFSEQTSCASSIYSQPGRDYRDERWNNVESRRISGYQDLDTSGYQVFDLDDVEFYWEIDQLDVDTVLRPGLDGNFSPSISNDS